MATFTIIKRESVSKRQEATANSFLDAAVHWSDIAAKDAARAKEASESSARYAGYAVECLNEAAKLLGFKNADEMDVYVNKHGKL